MSHEFETGFFTKTPAWHGLGVVLENAPIPADAIVMAGLDWKVALHDVQTADALELPVDMAKAVVRQSDKRVLGCVGNGFVPLQNSEAFEWITPLCEEGLIELEAAGSLRNGQRVWLLGRVVGAEEEAREGDVVKQHVLLAHGHDGTLAIRSGFTATRVVCMNTLSMAIHSKGNELMRIKHSMRMHGGLEKARNIIQSRIEDFHEAMGIARQLTQIEVDADMLVGYINRVFEPDSQEALERRVGQILPLFESGTGNGEGTAWDLYNGVTEFLTHVRGRNADTRLDSLWFGGAANTNERAWQEAMKLAA